DHHGRLSARRRDAELPALVSRDGRSKTGPAVASVARTNEDAVDVFASDERRFIVGARDRLGRTRHHGDHVAVFVDHRTSDQLSPRNGIVELKNEDALTVAADATAFRFTGKCRLL